MYAILNTKTGKLLAATAEVEERCYSYERPYKVAVLVLRATDFESDKIFVTRSKREAYDLLKEPKTKYYRDVYIDPSYYKLELSDLKVVRLKIRKKKKRRNMEQG
jgi:hypothetical protein